MDLSLPLLGVLGLVGYNLNKNINSREYIDKRIKIPLSDLPSGNSIYESKAFVRTKNQEQRRLDKFYDDSKEVKNTNKFTAAYRDKIKKSDTSKVVRFDGVHSDVDTKPVTKTGKIQNGPMFNTSKFFIPESVTKDFNPVEKFTDVSELSGKNTDFSHSNQVPFFGSHVRGSNTGATLEKFTGSERVAKTEVAALQNGMQNTYGQAAFTNEIDPDRFSSNLTNVQNNMLPFDQYKVPPIPGQYVRPEFKNVDELRTLNNPKTVNEGRINVGKSLNSRHVNNTGELKDVRIKTFYNNSDDRYLTTGNKESRRSYVDNSREDFRLSRKTQAVESKYNLGHGRDYKLGGVTRLTEEEDGIGALFNEGTTKSANKNEWIKSRGSRVANYDGENLMGTISIPSQERETSNRFELNNAHDNTAGKRLRFENSAKTTNKESTLYSYTGSISSQNAKNPEDREQYYNAQMKTKEHRGYTPGGASQFAQSSGADYVNISSKQRPEYSWSGPGKDNSMISPTADLLGSVRDAKPNVENDFGDRYMLQKYPTRTYEALKK